MDYLSGVASCGSEKGCAQGGVFDVVFIVVMTVVVVCLISRMIWTRWGRGPYPVIVRLLRRRR